MKNLRIYDILTEDGKSLAEITLSIQEDFGWADVFDKLYDFTTEDVQSYSYEEITVNAEQVDAPLAQLAEHETFNFGVLGSIPRGRTGV